MRPRLYNIAHTSPISAKRATRGFKIGPLRKRNPGRRLRRCARAASGHAAAAPPSSVMNWRRLRSSMGSSPEPAVPAYRRLRMPRKRPQVLGADLNRFESSGVARRLPQHRLNGARNVWLTAGGEMTSHGESADILRSDIRRECNSFANVDHRLPVSAWKKM